MKSMKMQYYQLLSNIEMLEEEEEEEEDSLHIKAYCLHQLFVQLHSVGLDVASESEIRTNPFLSPAILDHGKLAESGEYCMDSLEHSTQAKLSDERIISLFRVDYCANR